MKLSTLFRHGLTLTAGFWVMLSLDSCTIYQTPPSSNYVDMNQRRELDDLMAKANAAKLPPAPMIPIPPVEVDRPKSTIEACARFVPPPSGAIPRLTQDQIEVIVTTQPPTQKSVNVLVDELEKIYTYTSAEENALKASYAKHLKTCRKVTVEK